MGILVSLFIILISTLAIYYSGKYFTKASSNIGDYLRLPKDVKGATLDAVSSSLPELFVSLFSVIIFHQFSVGIGTIAGSALFNLLVIPALAVFVSPVLFKVSKKVITRDAFFYLIAVFILIISLVYFHTWGIGISLILLSGYILYLFEIINDVKDHHENIRKNVKMNRTAKEKIDHINIITELIVFFVSMSIIAIFSYTLTEASINLAEALNIPPIIIAFTIVAAATSVPDTVISLLNARKGDLDDATSNVFGSNIFDIFIGLGFPLLLYVLIAGPLVIQYHNLEIVFGLLGSTIVVLYILAKNNTLSKKSAIILLLMYLIFVAYVVLLAIK